MLGQKNKVHQVIYTYTCVCGAIKLEREKWKCQGLFLLFFFCVCVWVCCRLSARIIYAGMTRACTLLANGALRHSTCNRRKHVNLFLGAAKRRQFYAVIFRRALLWTIRICFFFWSTFFFDLYEIVTFESGGHCWNPPGLKRKETKNKQNNLYENWVRREWTRS
jgi:hypothetical protein